MRLSKLIIGACTIVTRHGAITNYPKFSEYDSFEFYWKLKCGLKVVKVQSTKRGLFLFCLTRPTQAQGKTCIGVSAMPSSVYNFHGLRLLTFHQQ